VVVRVRNSTLKDNSIWFIITNEEDNRIQENAKGSVLSLAALIQYLIFTS
jgi:hypothetical protein